MKDGGTDTDIPQTQRLQQVPLINSRLIGVGVRCSGTLNSAPMSWSDVVIGQ